MVVLGNIKINEFAIDQSPQEVEIINTASESANISNWYIDDSGGTTYYTVPQNTVLYGNSCLVFTGEFNLNKSTADMVRLFDNTALPTATNASLIDSYAYKSSPGAGKSYARNPDGSDNWTTNISTLGQYNETGINCIITPTQTPSPTDIPSPTNISYSASSTPPISYNNIFISEVMVYPLSGENEWIELFNKNNFSVSLHDWYFDDVENSGTTPKQFSLDLPAFGYGVYELSSSIFNNDQDNVRLLDFNKTQKDGFEYVSPIQNKTLGRISWNEDIFCNQDPSKGATNNSCINTTPIAVTNSTNKTPPSPYNAKQSSLPSLYQPISQIQVPSAKTTNPQPNTPAVLGIDTVHQDNVNYSPKNISFIKLLLSLSSSYSFLTIASVLVRIRNGSV